MFDHFKRVLNDFKDFQVLFTDFGLWVIPIGTYLNLLEPIWTYLNLLEPIWTYLNLFEPIWTYLNLLEPIGTYLNLLEPIGTYLEFADTQALGVTNVMDVALKPFLSCELKALVADTREGYIYIYIYIIYIYIYYI